MCIWTVQGAHLWLLLFTMRRVCLRLLLGVVFDGRRSGHPLWLVGTVQRQVIGSP